MSIFIIQVLNAHFGCHSFVFAHYRSGGRGIVLSYYAFFCLVLLQVAHHYPTIRHLTQTHPHAWLPKRVGTLFFLLLSKLYPNIHTLVCIFGLMQLLKGAR